MTTPLSTQPLPEVRAVLVAVGGHTGGPLHTLRQTRPPYICFLVSQDTLPQVDEILNQLKQDYTPRHYDWITVDEPQNLLSCYQAVRDRLPAILKKWGVNPANLGVDFTAATKPMSIAAVLATLDTCSNYFYVGSASPDGRTQGGIGAVVNGRESLFFQSNPWNVLAVRERHEIGTLCNSFNFSEAESKTRRLAELVGPEFKPIFTAQADLILAYGKWDQFDYREAIRPFGNALRVLEPYLAGRDDPLKSVLAAARENFEFLKLLQVEKGPDFHAADVRDLLANACRRLETHRYDDAVARLYSALEALARYRLEDFHHIRNHEVRPEQIPPEQRGEFIRRSGDPSHPKEPLRLGLEQSYLLLAALGDELGRRYLDQQDDLNKVLYKRNQSRLAHGREPIRPDQAQALRDMVFRFAGLTYNDLPRFPNWSLDGSV